jgi:hypothetical protein
MARFTTTIATPMTAEDAFDYVSDLRNTVQWDPAIEEAELVLGERPERGAVYRVRTNRTSLDYVTEVYDRPSHEYVAARSRLFSSFDRITVQPTPGGSLVTYDARLETRRILSPLGPLVSRLFDRMGDRAAEGLAAALGGERRDH